LNVGLWKFDEGEGDVALDGTRHGFHGEIEGAAWVAGITGELTISAWVRPEEPPSRLRRVVVGTYKYGGGGSNRRGWILGNQYGSTDQLYFRVYD
jgi:hypothetical protein